jgi:hypothetical protein
MSKKNYARKWRTGVMFDLMSTQILVTLHKEWLERNRTPYSVKGTPPAMVAQVVYNHSQQPNPTNWWHVLRQKLEGAFHG